MKKKEHIVSYTGKKLAAMRKQGKSRTDWAKVKSMPQKEVEKLADAEDGTLPEGWEKTVIIGLPTGKEAVKLRIDRDYLAGFAAQARDTRHAE